MPRAEANQIVTGEVIALPLKYNPAFACAASWAVILLMSGVLVAAVIRPAIIYPTKDTLRTSLPTDLVNLLGLPLLLSSVLMARRGSLVWLLLWPGALLYLLYHDLAYVFTMQPNTLFVVHLVLAALNLYATISLLAAIDQEPVRRSLAGSVHESIGGGGLAVFGILTSVAAITAIVALLLKKTVGAPSELALHVTDFLMSPTWIIGGVLLWRRKPLGYVTGLGLLFQASMLFIGLIMLFLLQPFISGTRFRITDTVVVFALGMVCFVPFALFVRGAWRRTSV